MSESLTSDVMDNIMSLNRDNSAAKAYTYVNAGVSNKLLSIPGLTAQNYNANGNAVIDGHEGIQLTYNYLNLS